MKILAAWLLVVSAVAAPASDRIPDEVDEIPLPESGNFDVPKRPDLKHVTQTEESDPWPSVWMPNYDALHEALSPLEEEITIKMVIYNVSVTTFGDWPDLKEGEERPISPPTFTNLWDNVVAASCNDVRCGEDIGTTKTPQHMGGIKGTLEMRLEGSFENVKTRDEIFAVLREAFDRSVVRDFPDNGFQMQESGPKHIFALTKDRDSLRAVISSRKESEEDCSDIVSRFMAHGELFSPMFGNVKVGC